LSEPLREQQKLLLHYRRTRSREVRDRLLEYYLPLVDTIARRCLLSHTTALDLEDLIGVGSLALFDSLNRYDPHRGVLFPVYATHRIRGAILDEFRKVNGKKRASRASGKAVETGSGEHRTALGVDGEPRQYKSDWVKGYASLDLLIDPRGNGSIDDFERREVIAHLTTTLSARERCILNLYYGHGITMREIAKCIGLSVPRISTMHASILGRLQARFKELKNEVFS